MVVYTKPLDGGWAWVIAFCGLYHHMCTTGLMFSMGVLYISWVDQFGGGKGSTSWIIAICFAITFGLCPIPANLAARLGFRVVGFIGGLLTCAGLVLSTFATSVTHLVLSIGIVSGLGSCFCYLPGVTVVAMYFDKHRSMAMGIATSGVGLGTFAFAPLITYLEQIYGWRGALLLCAGMPLNMCVSSLLLRPILIMKREVLTNSDAEQTTLLQKDSHHDQVPIVKLELADDGELSNNSSLLSMSEVRQDSNPPNAFIACSNEATNGLPKSLSIPGVTALRQSSNRVSGDSLHSSVALHRLKGLDLQCKGEEHRMCASLGDLGSKRTSSNHQHSSHNLNAQRADRKYHKSLFKSLQNVDLNMIGSVHGFHHILDKRDLGEEMLSLTSIETNRYRKCEDFSDPKNNTFISSLLSNPTIKTNLEILGDKAFLTLAFSNFLTNLSFITPVVYMVDRAVHQGIDKPTAAVLISANGFGNIVGRLFFGWLFDHCGCNRLMIYTVCISLCGVVTMLSSLCGSIFFLHASYAATFGCLMGIYTILAPLVTVDLMGVSRVAKSYGLLLSFAGAATVIGPPLAGWLFDWTKSYALSYVINGIFLLASGLILLPLLCTVKWKTNEYEEDNWPGLDSRH